MKKILLLLVFLLANLSYTNSKNITNTIVGKLINKNLKSNTIIIFRAFKINDVMENNVPAYSDTAVVTASGTFNAAFTAPGQDFYLEIEILNRGVRVIEFSDELTDIWFYSRLGDSLSVKINFDDHWVIFAGKGAEKMNCQYHINAASLPKSLSGLAFDPVLLKYELQSVIQHRIAKELLAMKYTVLRTYQQVLLPSDYERIKVNMNGSVKSEFLHWLMPNGGIIKKKIMEAGMFLELNLRNKESLAYFNPQKERSPYLIQIILKQADIRYYSKKHREHDIKPYTDWMIDEIEKNYDGFIRDDLYLSFFLKHLTNYPVELYAALSKVIGLMKNKEQIEFLKNEGEKFAPNKKVFPFVFEDESGKKIASDDFTDKIVLMDFWFKGCLGCLQIPPKIKIIMEKLKHRSDIVYLSINVDTEKKRWIDGLKNGLYTVPGQLHVFTGGGSKISHPFLEHYDITSFPHLTLIGKNGKVLSFRSDPRRDDGAEIVRLIENEK